MCHEELSHEGYTTQALAIPHDALPAFGRGCLRCHYQVTEPVHETTVGRCEACHDPASDIRSSGIGVDLHPRHVTVSCESCHETDTHHIESMSTAVRLVCADCHDIEHSVELEAGSVGPDTCVECHRDSHVGPQAVLLGIDPSRDVPRPAEHFTEGLTCRSCHAAADRSSTGRVVSATQRCGACHRPEYGTVGRWWVQGTRDRIESVEPYLAAAEAVANRLPSDDERRERLAWGRMRIELLKSGGGEHNIRFSHEILEDVTEAATAVFMATGVYGGSRPSLGAAPREGLCAYCHYRLGPAPTWTGMPLDFHREVREGPGG